MREERYALMLKQKEADGLIFLGHRLPRVAASVVQESAPHCAPIVNGCEFSAELGVPSVHIDNAKAAGEGMEHLYELGHRAIGVVTGPRLSPLSRDRLAGARSSARSRGYEQDLIIIQGDFSIRSGAEAADALMQRPVPPTAVFCFNDEMAMGVIGAARRRGLHIPGDLSVVGFDDIRFAECFEPALTTIAQPMRAIGEGTVRLLVEILNGGHLTPVSVTLPHQLQIRASTARKS
jgi:LacI family repressor for deo operon, udp, cdd, tsx, nupC, and nupG